MLAALRHPFDSTRGIMLSPYSTHLVTPYGRVHALSGARPRPAGLRHLSVIKAQGTLPSPYSTPSCPTHTLLALPHTNIAHPVGRKSGPGTGAHFAFFYLGFKPALPPFLCDRQHGFVLHYLMQARPTRFAPHDSTPCQHFSLPLLSSGRLFPLPHQSCHHPPFAAAFPNTGCVRLSPKQAGAPIA